MESQGIDYIYEIQASNYGPFSTLVDNVKVEVLSVGQDEAIKKAKELITREIYEIVSVKEVSHGE